MTLPKVPPANYVQTTTGVAKLLTVMCLTPSPIIFSTMLLPLKVELKIISWFHSRGGIYFFALNSNSTFF